jgi:3-keto-disaccharide hydrolase
MRSFIIAATAICVFTTTASAQYGELTGLKILKPEDTQHIKSTPPPEGAVVLFDGKSLEKWTKQDGKTPAHWKLVDGGAMQVERGGNIFTKEKFGGAFKLHVEFRVPYEPNNKGQGRGNSGVYVQGRYEVQVLDSYGLDSKNNDCGGIYEVAAPLKNVCKAPTIWQSYDIEFHAPTFENGKKTEPARMTVHHNGVKIHDNVKIPVDNTRAGAGGDPSKPGPIMLQDHGNPVQYRNIWLLPVKD